MQVTMTSQLTGKMSTMELDITQEQLQRALNRKETGELMQRIVPHLPGPEREFLMTGITPQEWESLFPEGDE